MPGLVACWLKKNGRSDRIRTYDPLVPNEVRYQTALHSDTDFSSGGRTYSDEGREPQGVISTFRAISFEPGLSQNRVARNGSADYVHAHHWGVAKR